MSFSASSPGHSLHPQVHHTQAKRNEGLYNFLPLSLTPQSTPPQRRKPLRGASRTAPQRAAQGAGPKTSSSWPGSRFLQSCTPPFRPPRSARERSGAAVCGRPLPTRQIRLRRWARATRGAVRRARLRETRTGAGTLGAPSPARMGGAGIQE